MRKITTIEEDAFLRNVGFEGTVIDVGDKKCFYYSNYMTLDEKHQFVLEYIPEFGGLVLTYTLGNFIRSKEPSITVLDIYRIEDYMKYCLASVPILQIEYDVLESEHKREGMGV